ncbi:MAG: phosphate transport system ATP-binding protein [Actinomycetota bacterium]|nr:phosphate transport system ATP-binding protein [Actinomycetota bacterium]
MRRPAMELVSKVDQEPQQEQADPTTGEATGGSKDAAPLQRKPARAESGQRGRRVTVRGLDAYYGDQQAVKGLDIEFAPNQVTAIIGPSGCGKSTLVRCLNRMHEEVPGARSGGSVELDGVDVYGSDVDVVSVRRTVGMVFQKPNPFPTMSVFDNVAAGLKLTGARGGKLRDKVERTLRGAGLWEEVKDRLDKPGVGLSGGQQQRLCIARTLAVEPEVILMDEPCSALDPIATLKIEELIDELKQRYTIVIVTHNMQQAGRVADKTAFMLSGELVEFDATEKIFTNPSDDRTEQYVTGKFG